MAEAADIRNRAYTLVVGCYDHVRRAVTFLHWDEGDIDTLVPSLFAGRKHKPADDAAQPAAPGANPPVITLPANPMPITPPAQQPTAANSANPSTPTRHIGPGGNPFMS